MRRTMTIVAALMIILSLVSCSKTATGGFQVNEKPADFSLFHLFDGYRSLESLWNSIDGKAANEKLADLLNSNHGDSGVFLKVLSELFESDPVFLDDLKGVVALLINAGNRHNYRNGIDAFYDNSGPFYRESFYKVLNDLTSVPNTPGISNDILEIVRKPLSNLMNTKNNDEIRNSIHELVSSLSSMDRGDFSDVTEFLGKILMAADYPMHLAPNGALRTTRNSIEAGDTNLKLGNASKGVFFLMKAIGEMAGNGPVDRDFLYDLLDDPFDSDTVYRVKQLISALEDHFTAGGDVYENNSAYNTDNSQVYSNADLRVTLKEYLPGLLQLLTRSDRSISMIDTAGGDPAYPLDLMVGNLQSIGFDIKKNHIKESLYDLMLHDVYGRSRKDDVNAWPTSLLESLLFLTYVTSNHGWSDGGSTNELSSSDDPNYYHGHGTYKEELTLNDSLFSISTRKTKVVAAGCLSFGYLGMYDVALKSRDRNHLFRSKNAFTRGDIDGCTDGSCGSDKDLRLYYNSSYGALNFLAGPSAGDLGSPDGGNPDGVYPGLNNYKPYVADGLGETQLSAWTMGWLVRSCWNGEGPYYYADPNAETVGTTFPGKSGTSWKKYLRPNGKIYAYHCETTGEYYYPADGNDPVDNAANGQRHNRYRSQWKTDYYMAHYHRRRSAFDQSNRYYTLRTNSSGNAELVESTSTGSWADGLTYNEIVSENDPKRSCSTPEEALFRNYQWVVTEKKMVLVIPVYLYAEGVAYVNHAIGFTYMIIEVNGYSGLANARKYRASNHAWAKKGSSGLSTIPGDYRIEILAKTDGYKDVFVDTADLMSEDSIYSHTLNSGHVTPSIVGMNLPALYRLAFPVSPEKDRGSGITDREVGSREFEADNSDPVWKRRNAFMPVLVSLLAGLRDKTPSARSNMKGGMRSFLNSITPLIKPLAYYQKGAGTHPRATWKPRVAGSNIGIHQGNPYLMSASCFGAPPSWNGSESERYHYQPGEYETLLSILIDGDRNNLPYWERGNGLLAKMMEYDTTRDWVFDQTPASAAATSYTSLFAGLEQIITAVKFSKETAVQINESNSKDIDYPGWMFAKRDIDVDGDELFDTVIGSNSLNKGLAITPDDKPSPHERWDDFEDTLDSISDTLNTFFSRGSQYDIADNIFNITDFLMANVNLTDDQRTGIMYTLGKFLAYYDINPDGNPLTDDATWMFQGDMHFDAFYNLVKKVLPHIHGIADDGTGNNYAALIRTLQRILTSDGMVPFIIDTGSIAPYGASDVPEDLYDWLDSDMISSPNSNFWKVMAQLLNDMGATVMSNPGSEGLYMLYQSYGFSYHAM